jgi:hypothetical protein
VKSKKRKENRQKKESKEKAAQLMLTLKNTVYNHHQPKPWTKSGRTSIIGKQGGKV